MREPERDNGRLQDIIQAAKHIISFTEGLSYEELSSDKLRYFAVVKNVEIIGEAAYMLSLEFKEKHSQIPWKDIIGMRHVSGPPDPHGCGFLLFFLFCRHI